MSKATDITAPHLWLVLARAYGSIAHYVEQTIVAQGLCLTDFMVLEALLHKGPLTISAIGDKVLLASASMTSAIDRLEKRAFAQRTFCGSDRRIRLIELTPAGRAFIVKLYAQHEQDLELITIGLTAAERKGLHAALKKLGLAAKAAVPARHESIA